MITETARLAVTVSPWASPESAPAMANDRDQRAGFGLTNRHLSRDGTPWIPISGEIHYSRVPRERWSERIRQMQAGGITVISFYVPWLHHVPVRGNPRFDGNLDVGGFIDEIRAAGLDVVLRIGPWAHGEMRNGGFPDWVQNAPVQHRSDDPAYLELVSEWFGQLGAALDGRCNPDTVLAIQIENELYDQPEHIRTLKRLARESGLSAPLWTATGWGGAQLPDPEVLPLFGGYGDGFWVDQDQPWDATFREHYFFSHVWDDPGIGADVRGKLVAAGSGPSASFPPATCEIGGGMATAYHRRPWPSALDVAAVSQCKIGNGSAWQGLYMYAGGTNPAPDLQESQSTDYPNDVTEFSYDFHAPIGEAGDLAPSHAVLRRQHFFLQAFGDRLAALPSHLPEVRPSGVDDSTTLRWAFRGDERSGFLTLAWHQPFFPLDTYRDASFRVVLGDETIDLPSRPVDIPAGTLAIWPVGLSIGGVRIDWATASVLTVLDGTVPDGTVPTLVLLAEAGIPVEIAVGAGARVHGQPAPELDGRTVWVAEPGLVPTRVSLASAAVDILVLPASLADSTWVQATPAGEPQRLLLSEDEVRWNPAGRVEVRTARPAPDVRAYAPERRAFETLPLGSATEPARQADVAVSRIREATADLPVDYGNHAGRSSAPTPDLLEAHSAVFSLAVPDFAALGDTFLHIDWAGDVGRLLLDGRVATDRFWDGSAWVVNLTDAGFRSGSVVHLTVLPLRVDSTVALPAAAAARLAACSRALADIDSVRVVRTGLWTEKS
jgi:beta-galactosidase